MKSLTNFLIEGTQTPFDIIQNLSQGSIGLLTMTIGRQKNKSKNGFLCYSEDDETVQLVAFDNSEVTKKVLDTDEYENLSSMKPQETKKVNGKLYVRLW